MVTGAASGIGWALARAFAREGMNVVLADLAPAPPLDSALFVRCDVTSQGQVESLANAARARFGPIHILCNNAGISAGGQPVWATPAAEWDRLFAVNLNGVLHGLRAFVPGMIVHNEPAHIVNTASLAGLVPLPGAAAYGVSKRAVIALSEALRLELRQAGAPIGVSVLCPAAVATAIADSSPDPKLRAVIAAGMPPEEVAAQTLAAIQEDRFWIFPHDASLPVQDRYAQDLLARNPPGFYF